MFHRAFVVSLLLSLAPLTVGAQVAGDLPAPTTPATPTNPTAPVEAPVQTPEQRVTFLLSAYHLFPSKEQLATAGSDEVVSQILRDLAQSPDAVPTLRLKAIDALSYYADAITVAYLVHTLSTPTDDVPEGEQRTAKLLRHHAVTSYAKLKGPDSLPVLEPLLVGNDLQLKLTAISAVGKQCELAGVERLKQLRSTDAHRAVQHEIRKFIQR